MVRIKDIESMEKYENLSESSKKRLEGALKKVKQSGFSVFDLLKLDDNDFRIYYGTNAKDLRSQRSVLKQLVNSKERRIKTTERVISQYKGTKYYNQVKRDYLKATATTFDYIQQKVKEHYFSNEKTDDIANRKANRKADTILSIPKSERKEFFNQKKWSKAELKALSEKEKEQLLNNNFDYDLLQEFSP